jgi:hypothetical protein
MFSLSCRWKRPPRRRPYTRSPQTTTGLVPGFGARRQPGGTTPLVYRTRVPRARGLGTDQIGVRVQHDLFHRSHKPGPRRALSARLEAVAPGERLAELGSSSFRVCGGRAPSRSGRWTLGTMSRNMGMTLGAP